MTCHHRAGDPDCSSSAAYQHREIASAREALKKERAASTPDKERFEIVNALRVGKHLVLKVLYPNCSNCSYEGNKVMVFLNVTEIEVLRWKIIDPHFRDPKEARHPREAPGPAARFPASDEGWKDACAWAHAKA